MAWQFEMRKTAPFLFFCLDLLWGRLVNISQPLVVGLHVTSRCNFRCVYCYGGYHQKKSENLTKQTLVSLIDELKENRTKYITLTGGEPLLRDDISEIVSYIKSQGIICSMNSNASVIPQKIEVVKQLDGITVSLDGHQREINDRSRGKGTFDKIVEGIQCLIKNQIPFDVVSVITKHNYLHIKEMLEFAKKNKFSMEFNFLQDPNPQSPFPENLEIPREIMQSILKDLIRLKKEGYPICYSNQARAHVLNYDYPGKIFYGPHLNRKTPPCYMGRFMCHIDSDGLVYPCIQLAGRFDALNFTDVGFKKAWENLQKKRACTTCFAVCYSEFNQIFDLRARAWFNSFEKKVFQKI